MRFFAIRLIAAILTFLIGVATDALWSSSQPHPDPRELSFEVNPYVRVNPGAIPQNLTVSDASKAAEPQFNPTGYYSFPDESPKGFESVEWVSIDTAETKLNSDYSIDWVAIPPQGFIRASGRNYEMAVIKLKGGQLSFSTKSVKGVGYYFTGSFTERGVFSDTEPTTVVLKGQLTKKRNGRKLAESNVGFIWFAGC